MSGHRPFSGIRRSLDAEGRARVDAIKERMATEETLEQAAASQAERLHEALGLPAGVEISFGSESVAVPVAVNDVDEVAAAEHDPSVEAGE